jgi:hypothetical protein
VAALRLVVRRVAFNAVFGKRAAEQAQWHGGQGNLFFHQESLTQVEAEGGVSFGTSRTTD